jgi:uncharacterized membrane protein
MQSINVLAVTPLFMSAFFGTGAACVVLAVAAGPLQTSSDGYVLAGSAAYLAGALLVTIFFHVPLNNRLAAARPTDAAGQLLWAFYIRRWTAWNHVRTVACVLAAAMLIRALR